MWNDTSHRYLLAVKSDVGEDQLARLIQTSAPDTRALLVHRSCAFLDDNRLLVGHEPKDRMLLEAN